MADPISVLGAATAVITLVELVGHAISSLSELRDQWKDADILFASLVAQLTALKAALCKIHNWISGSADLDYQFRMDLEVSLTCCKMLINRLGLFLSEIRGRNDSQDNIRLDTRSRIKLLVMKGGPMEEILGMVDRQIPVLNLLLTACNCQTVSDQRALLEQPTSRRAFNRMQDDYSSLNVLHDTESIWSQSTEDSSKLSVAFEFDGELLNTNVYERALRSSFRRDLQQVRSSDKTVKSGKDTHVPTSAPDLEHIDTERILPYRPKYLPEDKPTDSTASVEPQNTEIIDSNNIADGQSLGSHCEPQIFDWAGHGTSHVDFGSDETLPILQGRLLGHGVNGRVYEAICHGSKLAWKQRFLQRQVATAELQRLEQLRELDHPHITKLVGTYTHGICFGLLLLPVVTCDLASVLEDLDSLQDFTDDERTTIPPFLKRLELDNSRGFRSMHTSLLTRLRQSIGCITGAVSYLHQNGIHHGNIKPSNILLSLHGLWLADFEMDPSSYYSSDPTVAPSGERSTLKYLAPEARPPSGLMTDGSAADIFSLGCVFLETLALCNKYRLNFLKTLRPGMDFSFRANLRTIYHWFNFSGSSVDTEADQHMMGVIREMLSDDPRDRPTALAVRERLALIDALRSPYRSDSLWADCCRPQGLIPGTKDNKISPQPVTILIGNHHRLDGHRNRWKFFIQSSRVGIIDKIHIFLHPSFRHPYKVLGSPPFEFNGSGWGYFELSVLIALKPGSFWVHPNATWTSAGQSLLPLSWMLNFDEPVSQREVQVELGWA